MSFTIAPGGANSQPSISALSDGRFVAVWTALNGGDEYYIAAQFVDATGNPIGTAFAVDQPAPPATIGQQGRPTVAAVSADGTFVVAWEQWRQVGTNANGDPTYLVDVQARMFTAAGTPVASSFTVQTSTTESYSSPSITPLVHGGFVISSTKADGTVVINNIYQANGSLAVNSTLTDPNGDQVKTPDVAALANGGFVTVAMVKETAADADPDFDQYQVVARIRDGLGNITEIDVGPSSYDASSSDTVSVTTLSGGRFAVAYTNSIGPSSHRVIVKVFTQNGEAVGDPLLTTEANQDITNPVITDLPDGGFMAAWIQKEANGTQTVWRAHWNAAGTLVASNPVESVADNLAGGLSLTTLADGRVMLSWRGKAAEGTDIRGEIFDFRYGGVNILGTERDDHFIGTEFNDTIDAGSAGNDTLVGGDGIDTVTFHGATTALSVSLATSNASRMGGVLQSLQLLGFENAIGTQFADTLIGNDLGNRFEGGAGADILGGRGGNDTLDGGEGADIMRGHQDDDTYYVDNAGDVVEEGADNGYDTVISAINVAQLYDNVEHLTLSGAAIEGYGNALANRITGNGGGNDLRGAEGDDTLDGGLGNDTLDGGVGADTAIFGGAWANYTVTMEASGALRVTNKTGEFDIVSNVESFTFADTTHSLAEVLASIVTPTPPTTPTTPSTPTPVPATLYTATSLTLPAGALNLIGTGKANITLVGNAVANTIKGNAGKNVLKGLAGNDKLWGGLGNDTLYGGTGKDVFVFNTKPNKKTNLDKIADFNVKDDTIWLDNKVFTKLGKGTELRPGKLNKKFFTIGDSAKDANDYLVYNAKKGVLYYDVDGSGAKAAVEIATLKKGLKLTYADFFVI